MKRVSIRADEIACVDANFIMFSTKFIIFDTKFIIFDTNFIIFHTIVRLDLQ